MHFGSMPSWTHSSSILATPASSLHSTPTSLLATTPSSFGTVTPSSAVPAVSRSSIIGVEDCPGSAIVEHEHLPALFSDPKDLSFPLTDHTTSPSASTHAPLGSTLSNVKSKLGPAPCSYYGWPFLYMCDMAAGFTAMQKLEDLRVEREVAFKQAFQAKYVHSTWSDNSQVWSASAQMPELRDTWI